MTDGDALRGVETSNASGGDGLKGCPVHALRAELRRVGLRPTRQRVSLGWLLFAKGDRHVTAEMLYEEANRARVPVSLATVYNTLHQFTEAGLLRQVAVDGSRTYFDTNTGDHHHFLVEGEDRLVDIPGSSIDIANLPEPPEGMEIARVDVVVRLRPRRA
ncbi:iron response transcriptional regulator IrrA [Camelimonas abortus]|uniref:Ferric uptake regulation protein n=1 Tax=Camelimonas abortus TaxID=1017184 RepID=A0ABV7LGX3_9HYPH